MDETKPTAPETLSVDQIEEIYGISRQVLIKAIKEKKLKGYQIPSKAYVVEKAEVERYASTKKWKHKSNVK